MVKTMIICSCNRLSDDEVCSAIRELRISHWSEVHDALGCAMDCGACRSTMEHRVQEAREELEKINGR